MIFNKEKNRWMVSRGGRKRAQYRARVIMEQILGRPLQTDEHVHHINGNPQDDRPENLRVVHIVEHGSIHSGKLDDQMMLERLRTVTERLGHAPSGKQWDAMGEQPSSYTYQVHFGSWFTALKLAGVIEKIQAQYRPYLENRGLPDEALLQKLKNLAHKLKKIPTLSDIDNSPDMPSSRTYYDRFGGIIPARKLAGLQEVTER